MDEPLNTRHNGRILPLPDDVATQLKSAYAIVSLNAVVIDLLNNSLDAHASNIDLAVDHIRGACTIDDDGLGIPPQEFKENGHLCKPYCTSKYYCHDAVFGRNGTFLSSLSAVSLLTIISHHHEHRSHNAITIHQSKLLERQLPTTPSNEIHGKHGTRVTVRNLFGNLPVRVKQRAIVAEQKLEHDRQWEYLKRETMASLLSCERPVSLKIRDSHHRVVFSFNTINATQGAEQQQLHPSNPRLSKQLSYMLKLLTQAGYVSVDEWSFWVPVSAVTSTLAVKGAISLVPAPSRNVQFISLDCRPLSSDLGRNELYDQINHLFELSSFGTTTNDAELNELNMGFGKNVEFLGRNGQTSQQVKTRRPVERYPMFHLRISARRNASSKYSEDTYTDDQINFQDILELLTAVVSQWLQNHHFHPSISRNSSPSDAQATKYQSSASVQPASMAADDSRRRRPIDSRASNPAGSQDPMVSSRTKSRKLEFCCSISSLSRRTGRGNTQITSESTSQTSTNISEFLKVTATASSSSRDCLGQDSKLPLNTTGQGDGTIVWTDPSTSNTYSLSARTGFVTLYRYTKPISGISSSMLKSARNHTTRPYDELSHAIVPTKVRWLDELLDGWSNPVFPNAEGTIEQAYQHGRGIDQEYSRHWISGGKGIRTAQTSDKLAALNARNLFKPDLFGAEIIAQVDRKFILVKVPSRRMSDTKPKLITDMLILIDQHAADERIQVESLFQELCCSPGPGQKDSSYQSRLGQRAQVASIALDKPQQFMVSQQEYEHFVKFAPQFATWGLLFDIFQPCSSNTADPSRTNRSTVVVTHLPPSILERCRADPQLLISLLRSTVWSYATASLPPSAVPLGSTFSATDWVRRLASLPPNLIEMINSRACRSAIMFNDRLSVKQCKTLVHRLSSCRFPFNCAHGRPTLVPLMDLVAPGHTQEPDSVMHNNKSERGFVKAWVDWKNRLIPRRVEP